MQAVQADAAGGNQSISKQNVASIEEAADRVVDIRDGVKISGESCCCANYFMAFEVLVWMLQDLVLT